MKTIILTSDQYTVLLPAFAHCWRQHWYDPTERVDIIGFEPPAAVVPPFVFTSLGKQADFSWSGALLHVLSAMEEDYFLLGLDDYFLSTPVPGYTLSVLEHYIAHNPQVGKIDLTGDRLRFDHTVFPDMNFIGGMVQATPTSPYQMSVQMALWRKDFLLKYLEFSESAWTMEKAATRRLIGARLAGEETRLVLGCAQPPVQYVNASGNGHPGWLVRKRFGDALWHDLEQNGLIEQVDWT